MQVICKVKRFFEQFFCTQTDFLIQCENTPTGIEIVENNALHALKSNCQELTSRDVLGSSTKLIKNCYTILTQFLWKIKVKTFDTTTPPGTANFSTTRLSFYTWAEAVKVQEILNIQWKY